MLTESVQSHWYKPYTKFNLQPILVVVSSVVQGTSKNRISTYIYLFKSYTQRKCDYGFQFNGSKTLSRLPFSSSEHPSLTPPSWAMPRFAIGVFVVFPVMYPVLVRQLVKNVRMQNIEKMKNIIIARKRANARYTQWIRCDSIQNHETQQCCLFVAMQFNTNTRSESWYAPHGVHLYRLMTPYSRYMRMRVSA